MNQRRKTDQLTFPLQQANVGIITTEKNYKPSLKTDLEKEIYGLLTGGKLNEDKKVNRIEPQHVIFKVCQSLYQYSLKI